MHHRMLKKGNSNFIGTRHLLYISRVPTYLLIPPLLSVTSVILCQMSYISRRDFERIYNIAIVYVSIYNSQMKQVFFILVNLNTLITKIFYFE